MKTYNTTSIRRMLRRNALSRYVCYLGVVLLSVLIAHTAALSQQLPVDLKTAGNFVILAKTEVTTTGTTAVTGDIGLSPAAASFITGFTLTLDLSGTFSTSSLVTGKIYAADYTSPTPTYVGTAVSDMQTAYTDAAGRTTPDFTDLGAGDITGKTLTPGLYKWGTGVTISAGGVTISGSATDVWIFQIAGDLTVANAAIVTLSGGAQASNIFWQVAGQVTIGTTAQMKGIILCQTQIALNTGASLNGRALAQTAVTLDGNAVTKPAAAAVTEAVTFTVHMGSLMQSGGFNPTTDSVVIRGDFQMMAGDSVNWNYDKFVMTQTLANDSIYTLTIVFPDSAAGKTINYQFLPHHNGVSSWGDPNRTYAITTDASQLLPLAYINNVKPGVVATVNITFEVNMANLIAAGFTDSRDSIFVNGTSPLPGWGTGGAKMSASFDNPQIYEAELSLKYIVGSSVRYKAYGAGQDAFSNGGYESAPPGSQVDGYLFNFPDKDTTIEWTPILHITTPTLVKDTVVFHVDMNNAYDGIHYKAITGVKSVWITGSVRPLNWPPAGWPLADTSKGDTASSIDTTAQLHRMYDNGTHGDSLAGDNRWAITLVFSPGASSYVEYKYGAVFNGSDTLTIGGAASNGSLIDNESAIGGNHNMTLSGSKQLVYNHFGDQDPNNPGTVGVRTAKDGIPSQFELTQNYPNPFNPTTQINYSVPKNSFVTLKIYNVLGQEVATLFAGNQRAGSYIATFDATKFASGVYFYRLQAGTFSSVKKMVLMK